MDRAEAKHGNDEESESEAAVRRAALLSGRVRHGAAATQKMHDDRSLKDLGTKMSEINGGSFAQGNGTEEQIHWASDRPIVY